MVMEAEPRHIFRVKEYLEVTYEITARNRQEVEEMIENGDETVCNINLACGLDTTRTTIVRVRMEADDA